ncbi:hypothetical protein OG455_29370 [Kitasatospora sp. NBC_01287]|uniref:hypothetical protein n=1 Tax=Kitasatospora sp. NBC_01287 TaxID=2903573 RepID=UPI002255B65B|nr:hypothetical protein [Kitasatospora sp. NBC_01287]MCX4749574.1 hypothetical protein [Kitasatospora sp. NBC_01287]
MPDATTGYYTRYRSTLATVGGPSTVEAQHDTPEQAARWTRRILRAVVPLVSPKCRRDLHAWLGDAEALAWEVKRLGEGETVEWRFLLHGGAGRLEAGPLAGPGDLPDGMVRTIRQSPSPEAE